MAKKYSQVWLGEFTTHDKWFGSLTKRRRGKPLSKAMRANYNSSFKQFFEFLDSKKEYKEWNPDSLIKLGKELIAIGETGRINDLLSDFSNWLTGKEVSGYNRRVLSGNQRYNTERTAYTRAFASVKSFFVHNGIPIPKSPRMDEEESKVKSNDYQYQVLKRDRDTGEIIKEFADIKIFINALNFRDRVIDLALISTGQDIGEILNLNIIFVQNLRNYIAKFRQGARPNEPIFMTKNRSYRGEKITEHPLNTKQVSDNFYRASKELGYTNGGISQHPFRPKRFRSIFRTACNYAEIKDSVRRLLMGHAKTMGDTYDESAGELENYYSQLEPLITIFVGNESAEVKEAQTKAENALGISLRLEQENKELKETINQLTQMVVNLKADFEEMQDDAEVQEEIENSTAAQLALKSQTPVDIQTMYEQMKEALKKIEESGQVKIEKKEVS